MNGEPKVSVVFPEVPGPQRDFRPEDLVNFGGSLEFHPTMDDLMERFKGAMVVGTPIMLEGKKIGEITAVNEDGSVSGIIWHSHYLDPPPSYSVVE